MSCLGKFVCVEDLIHRLEEPSTAMGDIIELGSAGKLDFYIPLKDVFILWTAVFGDASDLLSCYQILDREMFKITKESFEDLVIESKKDRVKKIRVSLAVPDEIKAEYKFNQDSFSFELRGFCEEDDSSWTDLSNNDEELDELLNFSISTVWVKNDQAEILFKKNHERRPLLVTQGVPAEVEQGREQASSSGKNDQPESSHLPLQKELTAETTQNDSEFLKRSDEPNEIPMYLRIIGNSNIRVEFGKQLGKKSISESSLKNYKKNGFKCRGRMSNRPWTIAADIQRFLTPTEYVNK